MRFHRFGKYEFRDTERKRAAFARKQKAEREALPLFADQVAAEQIDSYLTWGEPPELVAEKLAKQAG